MREAPALEDRLEHGNTPSTACLAGEYFLAKLPEVYGKIEPVVFDSKSPKLALGRCTA
jgi:hypothetical protein